METEISYWRWGIYFAFGVPFLAWLFFTRSMVLKVLATVAVLVCIQQSFTYRQYLWAFGVGPSVITAYTAFMSLLLTRGRFPNLGSIWVLYALFLFTAITGALVGSLEGGYLIRNVYDFQILYLEGFLFFLIGAMAFTKDDELRNFLFFWVMLGLVVALVHAICMTTGYRFRDFAQAGDEVREWNYGGFFNNANTQGSFYSMTIPIALLLLVGGRLPAWRRFAVVAATVLMVGSLLQSVHRGGILTTSLLSVVLISITARRPAVALGVGGAVAISAAVAYWTITTFSPYLAEMAFKTAEYKGTDSPRFEFWPLFLQMAIDNPLGVGLSVDNIVIAKRPYGIAFTSPHNLYLTVLLQAGFAGLFAFLALTGAILLRNLRAWWRVRDPARRQLLLAVAQPLLAFFVVGVSESVWENGFKINQIFWLWCGISAATSARALAELRASSRSAAPVTSEFERSPAFGR